MSLPAALPPELFDATTGTYPDRPGVKSSLDTTIQAAAEIASEAKALQAACLRELATHNLTADETAAQVGRDKMAIRPRFSELKAKGLIRDTGERRKNASGKRAAVWQAV